LRSTIFTFHSVDDDLSPRAFGRSAKFRILH
jgi:hypothetical protein